MKSLEETIKLKCKFLGNMISPLYLLPPDEFFPQIFNIYRSKNNIDARDEITLLEEMTPLLVYLCSCIIFGGGRYNDLLIKLRFGNSELTLDNSINVYFDGLFQNPLHTINENNDQTRSFGYCLFFTDTFRIELSLKQDLDERSSEEEEEEEETKTIEKFEEEAINDLKTFKTDNCIICLDNSSMLMGILGQTFTPILPPFLPPRTTFKKFLNTLIKTHLDISYNSIII